MARVVTAAALMAAVLLGGRVLPVRAQRVDPNAYRAPARTRATEEESRRLLRNQAEIRAALEDLRTDVQVTQAKVDELTGQFALVLAELQNLRAALADGNGGRATAAAPSGSLFPRLARPQQPGRTQTAPPRISDSPRDRPRPPPTARAPGPPAPRRPPTEPDRSTTIAAVPAAAVSEEEKFGVYESALNDYHSQNYALARDAFASFLARFPKSTYANNAQFYIGQCYYAEGKFADAVAAYQSVVDRYPGGTKVPSALLKIGYAREKLGQTPEAKLAFQQVIDVYPFSSEAQLARNRLKRL